MIRLFATYCLLVFATLCAAAQVVVSGCVVEMATDEPLAGASVIVKGPDGKIKKFGSTKADGGFSLEVPSVEACRLEVTMMSFAKASLPLDSAEFPLTVRLEPGNTLLREVTVKADRIREQGDTITYNVGSFAQEQDRTIGDVLQRMPGISVEQSGKIQYQGEDINKFYIEGSDLLGGKYGIATNGISHEDVGAVEVMENHQPMQVLSGISFSDKAAINLKLKEKAKATWSFHGDAGAGYSWQPEGVAWDGEVFAMAVMPAFQNITTLKTNNTGTDLSAQATDFFAARHGTDLSPYVNVALPSVPNLSRKRTLFNRSVLVSTNNLWKFGKGEVKAQIDYSFNRVRAEAANVTTYFLTDADHLVTENREGTQRAHALSAKFIYELNEKTAFINNTLRTNLDWDDVHLAVSGSLTNEQSASLPAYFIGNDFKLIKRFNGKHLVTFTSKNEWESMPQALTVENSGQALRQSVSDHAFFTDESAAYALTLKGLTLSLEGGLKAYLRSLSTALPELPDAIPGTTQNVLSTNYFTVYATPKFEYWFKRVNITLGTPLSLATYHFDKAIADRSEVYFSPKLSLNWKPSNRFSMGLAAGSGRSPMSLDLIQPGIVMTDYRSFRRGVDNFYTSSSQNVSANFSYKHTRRGLFANAFALQSWSHLPYTLAQELFGDYVVYSYSSAKSDASMLMAGGNLGKTLNFMRGSLNINGSFSRNESRLLSESQTVNSVGTSWTAGAKISGTPLRWLSFDYRFGYAASRLAMNGFAASWLGNIENELLLNMMPHKKWEWRVSGEHYRNELTAGRFKNVFLLDTRVIYKLNRRLELSATLSNLFNQRTYNYTSYNQLNSYESRRYLRGRELMLTISLKK